MGKITTTAKKFNCSECNNEVAIPEDAKVGDYFECEFCGIEYEILEVTDAGEYVIQVVEEEK